jgi:hypothetical protein
MNSTLSFKDRHRELQEIVREHTFLRDHNRSFKEGDSQATLLLIAEAALICLVLERFLRAILGTNANESDSLFNLLEKATSKRHALIRVPWNNQEDGIRKVVNIRNTLLHGNYEQAAQEAGCSGIEEYFRNQFAAETEGMYKIVDHIFRQIDSATGLPYPVTR